MRRAIVLLTAMTVMVASYAGMALGASQLTNGGFENGDLSGWSVSVAPGGNASAVTSYKFWTGTNWTPKEGSYFALLTPGAESVDTMISQPFSAANGDKVSGWVFFQAEEYAGYYDDKGQVLIKDQSGTVVAKTFEESVNSVGNFGNSGWRYWEHTFTGEGTFRIEARVHNLNDSAVPSRIGLDDVKTSGTVDTTDPVLTLPGNITEEATGPNGAAVTFAASATDENPKTPDVTCSKNSGDTFPTGTTTVTCSAKDSTGNEATGSFDVKVVDTKGPALDLPQNKVAEATGPTGAAVEYAASATDAVDGKVDVNCATASGDTFKLGETTVDCSAKDSTGNEAKGSFTVTVKDTTAPALELPADITEEATSSSGAKVEYKASANDLVDGTASASCSPASGSTFALGTTTVTCTATDAAGNEATPTTFTVKVQDTIAPNNIQFVGNINDGDSFFFGDVPAQPTCTASDAVGLKDCVVSGYSTAVGPHTLTATATDNAGNSATKTLSYTVKPWTLKGFYAPVNMSTATTKVWNTVKNGSTVPMKFEIFKGTNELTDTANVKMSATKLNCDTGTEDEIEVTATGSTSLRYDTTSGQFIYNWKTPTGAGTCYSVTATASDGSSQTAYFKLK